MGANKMTLYQVLLGTTVLGIYSGQRPSAAACKAFSVMRRKDPSLGPTRLSVVTEGRKKTTEFMVEYKNEPDAFLNISMQPVATKLESP
jgi:hypothetical protein